MDQMNVSITDTLASYVREKVASGRYNNASEVVREALRRMEEEDERAMRLAQPTVEDILGDLTASQLDGIRKQVLAGIEEVERGEFIEINGRQELKAFMEDVKVRGRQRAAARKA